MGCLCALVAFAACGDAPDEPRDAPAPRGAASAKRAPEPARDAEAGPLVLFLGDSLSAGLHLPSDEAFPAVLQRALADEGVPFRLLNAGSSGDTTAGGLRRIDWLLERSPDWVVVELGGNDGLRGVPVESIEANLNAIVERAQAKGARVVLLGMKLPPNYGAEYTSAFEAAFASVAARHELPFVPFFLDGVAGVAELNLPDGIHPTTEGHERAAANLVPVFRELLGAEAAATSR